MKWLATVFLALCLLSLVFVAWHIDEQGHRIVQLECALAQAHAHADSLEWALAGQGEGILE